MTQPDFTIKAQSQTDPGRSADLLEVWAGTAPRANLSAAVVALILEIDGKRYRLDPTTVDVVCRLVRMPGRVDATATRKANEARSPDDIPF